MKLAPLNSWKVITSLCTVLTIKSMAIADIPDNSPIYSINDRKGTGSRFDGIGAISGGGATSKLLYNYPEDQRNNILDYLFKPNFGASLQILKVEIGGDSQSTDGSEASHMHSADDLNFNRGYEWWLMKEAKARNPDIKLYGLPWVFPGWLGGNDFNPFSNITNTIKYTSSWIVGAKLIHNLTIDYIGVWNERNCSRDYVLGLREQLDQLGYSHVQIVVADGGWQIVDDLLKDKLFLDAIGVIGVHYPDSQSPSNVFSTGKTLWASEEYSANNNISGGGCWARILNEGYVNGYLTANIAWNLITSYYDYLPYTHSSLMTANSPWSGNYVLNTPIWMTAHFTQFIKPGWEYLLHGSGVGHLNFNGTYTALTNDDHTELTVIVVALNTTFANCFYPMPQYGIAKQNATFKLQGSFSAIKYLHVWHSKMSSKSDFESDVFRNEGIINITDGQFSLSLGVDDVYTLTTISTGIKGKHPNPPPAKDFVIPYVDTFDTYEEITEPFNLAQQAGAFEVQSIGNNDERGQIVLQTVPQPPVDTCRPERMTRPVAVIGDYAWSGIDISIDFMIKDLDNWADGVFLAARVDTGGCYTMYSNGLYLWAYPGDQLIQLSANYSASKIYANVSVSSLAYEKWFSLGLSVHGNNIVGSVDGAVVINITLNTMPSKSGFAALGTTSFDMAYFDNLNITSVTYADNEVVIKQAEEIKIKNDKFFEDSMHEKQKYMEWFTKMKNSINKMNSTVRKAFLAIVRRAIVKGKGDYL